MKIYQILDKIDDNQIFIPAFQREYVWDSKQVKMLLYSLINDYPTGTMLTWETSQPPELKGDWKHPKDYGPVKLILDGQQRITTLYMLIRGEIPPYYHHEEIKYNDHRNLCVNLDSRELRYYKQREMANNPLWVHLTDVFQKKVRPRAVVEGLRGISDKGEVPEELQDRIDDNLEAIKQIPDRDFLEQMIPIKVKIEKAIDIFYIVNSSGVRPTTADLALAYISGYWPDARAVFKNKLKSLEKDGFPFKLDFIIYALLGVLHHSGSEMKKLHNKNVNLGSEGEKRKSEDDIKEVWKALDDWVIDYVINILRTRAAVDHRDEISQPYSLIPIIVFCFRKGKGHLSQEEIDKIIKWFFYAQLRQRYSSQMDTKLDRDLGVVVGSTAPFDELLNVIERERPLKILPSEFEGVSNVRHPLWALMRLYFKSRGAVCFTTGVGLRKNMGKKYALEWDHLFPSSVLRESSYGKNNRLAQEITNRAVLTQAANRSKSNKSAESYLAMVQKDHPDALKLQSIPSDQELWKLENYEQFLSERRRMLAGELNEFLEGITSTLETEAEFSLDELISEGEGVELEFKSSLRWSLKGGREDKRLEDVILKTIAAFSNSAGGTLLIGVDDEGEAIGLGHDYRSLKGNKDEFELHLRNLINHGFSKSFAASNITVKFHRVGDREVCKIEIQRAYEPQYIKVRDKNNSEVEKFYVRNGNSSVDLPVSEVSDYIKSWES